MKREGQVPVKQIGKQDRKRHVLMGLVEYYIQTGKPVGSQTLKGKGFEDLSSATIRNYFANLEEEGYLTQSHSSGGRIPTHLAYRIYAKTYLDNDVKQLISDPFQSLRQFDSREIALFLQKGGESLSQVSQCAVFLSAPRFDQDFVIDVKLVPLDAFRSLCVLVTDFGVVQTEILHLPQKLSSFAVKRIESYFQWRLKGVGRPENLEPEEEAMGQAFYNELMLRYIVGYSTFLDEEIYRTGFSSLLAYSDFQEATLLTSGLSLFENIHGMRLLLKECTTLNRLMFWIGADLTPHTVNSNCSVIAVPYSINHKSVGAVGILGPVRLPYRFLFRVLRAFSDCVSDVLTRNVYKFKISFRQPEAGKVDLHKEECPLIGQSRLILLEDKRAENT